MSDLYHEVCLQNEIFDRDRTIAHLNEKLKRAQDGAYEQSQRIIQLKNDNDRLRDERNKDLVMIQKLHFQIDRWTPTEYEKWLIDELDEAHREIAGLKEELSGVAVEILPGVRIQRGE